MKRFHLHQHGLVAAALVAGTSILLLSQSSPVMAHTTSSSAVGDLESQRLALDQWSQKLAVREAQIRQREAELGLKIVGGKGPGRGLTDTRSTYAVEGGTAEVLVFEDLFEDLDMDVWNHDITMAGGGNWEFQYYTNNRTNSYVEDGVLYLQPTLTENTIGAENVIGEKPFRMDIWGMWPSDACTSNAFYGCERISDQAAKLVINPVQSARLRTTGTFTFKYGRLEVEAKLPRGDWLWPAIWLLPEKNRYGSWPQSGEIDVMETRGNKPGYVKGGYDSFGSCLHWGPYFALDKFEDTCKSYTLPQGKGTFNDDFHVFGLVWNENELYTYLDTDDNKILEVKFDQPFWKKGKFDEYPGVANPWQGRPNAAPFDQPFYLILNVAVGGLSNFFVDGEDGKPWTNKGTDAPYLFYQAKDTWYETWAGKDSALQVKSVRVWQTRDPTHPIDREGPRTPSAIGPTFDPSSHSTSSRSSSSSGRSGKGKSHVGSAIFGVVLFLLFIGGGVLYALYLKMGDWPWRARNDVNYSSVEVPSSGPATYQGARR